MDSVQRLRELTDSPPDLRQSVVRSGVRLVADVAEEGVQLVEGAAAERLVGLHLLRRPRDNNLKEHHFFRDLLREHLEGPAEVFGQGPLLVQWDHLEEKRGADGREKAPGVSLTLRLIYR